MDDRMKSLAALVAGLQQAGQQPPAVNNPAPAPSFTPTLDNAPQAPDAPYDFHGMFGIHGKGRDILGALGDAFLVQSGNKPIYGPQRDQEQDAQALQGFVQNPLAAIQRLSRDNPGAAEDMYEKYVRNAREGRAADEAYTGTVTDRGTRLLGVANEQNWPQVKAQVEKYFAGRNVPMPFQLPDKYDPDAVRGLMNSSVPTYRQISEADTRDYHQATTDYRHENLDERRDYHQASTSIARDRNTIYSRDVDSRDTRGKRPTTSTVIGDLMHKESSGAQMTPAEQKTLDAYRNHSARSSPSSVIGGIMEKQAKGDPLTPAEQSTLTEYRASLHGSRRASPSGAGGPVQINNDADYAKLPKGAMFRDPHGNLGRKS